MRRQLLCIVIWLCLSVAPIACAADFTGFAGETIHFGPSIGPANDRYCLMPPSDTRYAGLRKSWEAAGDIRSLRVIFIPCESVPSPFDPSRVGYVSILQPKAVGPTSDFTRSDWLAAIKFTAPPGVKIYDDGYDNSARYGHYVLPWPTDQYGNSDGIFIGVTALTVVKNTPIEITILDQKGNGEIVAAVTALDEDRATLRLTLKGFGAQNGFSIDQAASTEQMQDALSLGESLLIYCTCGILLVTLTVRALWAQAALSVGTALAAVMIYQAAPGSPSVLSNSAWDRALWSGVALAVATVGNGLWILGSLVPLGATNLTARLKAVICTGRWNIALTAPDQTTDLTKRWFVTVAAMAGSAVGSLFEKPDFFNEFAQAFGPDRIVFTIMITLLSVTLIGPVEAFVFQSRIAARTHAPAGDSTEEESTFEHMIELLSPRAIGRFVLVLVAMLALTVTHGAIEARIHSGAAADSSALLVGAVGPAIVTYYWCAGLQRGVGSVAVWAGLAVSFIGLLLLGIPEILLDSAWIWASMARPLGWTVDYDTSFAGLIILPLTIVALGLVVFSGQAFGGGAIIDVARRRRLSPTVTVALIGPVLVATMTLFTVGQALVAHLTKVPGMDLSLGDWGLHLLPIVGWILGLIVSGFPKVLQTGALRAHADPRSKA